MNKKILLGKIVGAIGIKGEVKVYSKGGAPRLDLYDSLIIVPREEHALDSSHNPKERASGARHDDLSHCHVSYDGAIPGHVSHDGVSPACADKSMMLKMEKARIRGSMAVVKLFGIDDRNAAEALRDAEVYVDEEDLPELPDNTYYVKDLEGMKVMDFDTSEEVGVIAEVIQNSAQDIYRILLKPSEDTSVANNQDNASGKGNKEALVPAVKEFIKEVNIEEGFVRIHFIEGMR